MIGEELGSISLAELTTALRIGKPLADTGMTVVKACRNIRVVVDRIISTGQNKVVSVFRTGPR